MTLIDFDYSFPIYSLSYVQLECMQQNASKQFLDKVCVLESIILKIYDSSEIRCEKESL
jgi:hypothetical protein